MDVMKAFTGSWLSHRKSLELLVDKLSDEHLSYTPWEGAMSLSELVVHTVGATNMFVTIVKEGEQKPAGEPQEIRTAEELRKLVRDLTANTQATLETITDAELSRTVQFASMSMTGQAMLDMAKEHEIHHKGQLLTYARMCGIEDLPFFIIR